MFRTFIIISCLFPMILSCKKETGNCSDGIQNNNETGVDCGGPCGSCNTCHDGIRNGDETGIDCGGAACIPCGSVICDGNGDISEIPMKMFNSWYYRRPGVVGYSWTITGTQIFGQKSYYRFENYPYGWFRYLRISTNGDIMRYDLSNSEENLYIPSNPVINQAWSYNMDQSVIRKIISTNASYSTLKCSYSSLLEIHNYDSAGNISSRELYHKGVGLISTHDVWMGSAQVDLEQIILH